jgi:tetratricopeptide (TPR) repeat protein
MPLQRPFSRRVARIQAFLKLPPFRVLELQRPPDLEVLVRKLLAQMGDDATDPHAWVYVAPAFEGYRAFFQALVDAVGDDVDRARPDLTDLGSVIPEPPVLTGEEAEDDALKWARRTADYLSAVAEALPDAAGSLVLLVEPASAAARRALGWSLGALAWYLRSDRMKVVVVVEGGEDPLVPVDGGVEDRIIRMSFAVPPGEMEDEVLSDLESGLLPPAEARRYGLLAGAFATSGGRFGEAEARLRQTLAEAREAEAGEEANVLYNLGNLYIRTERFEAASEALAPAASSALEAGNHALGAMALTNLGVALHGEGRGHEALGSFEAARRLFQALGHRPGEAHVLDCTARAWSSSDPERARELWEEAAALYDSIEAPHLADVRRAGVDDIRSRLRHLDAPSGTD